jgi:hypothetical protein
MDGGNIMVLKYITKGGTRIHGPPYTKAEEAEFYRRQGRGPVIVVRPLMTVKSRSPEHRGGRRRQNLAVLKDVARCSLDAQALKDAIEEAK